MVEDFVAYVGCVTGLGDCLLGHPLWQAVVLFCKSGLAVELTLHLNRFLP